jgi:kojibiose phosphorylase
MGGSHPAANGGAWMTAVFGFGGVRAEESRVVVNPRLPAQWRRLEFGLDYQRDRFRLCITPDVVTVHASASNRREHVFAIAGETFVCRPGGSSIEVNYRGAADVAHRQSS